MKYSMYGFKYGWIMRKNFELLHKNVNSCHQRTFMCLESESDTVVIVC